MSKAMQHDVDMAQELREGLNSVGESAEALSEKLADLGLRHACECAEQLEQTLERIDRLLDDDFMAKLAAAQQAATSIKQE